MRAIAPNTVNTRQLSKTHLDEDVTDKTTGGSVVVSWRNTLGLSLAIPTSEGSDADTIMQVDLTGNGGGAHIVPIWIIWGQLSAWSCLNYINPIRQLDFVTLLQVCCICLDEFCGRHIADGCDALAVLETGALVDINGRHDDGYGG